MDSMDNFRERFEALEQQTEQLKHETQALKAHTHTVERRLRWWRGIACGLVFLSLGSLPLPSSTADDDHTKRVSKSLEQRVEVLQHAITALQHKLAAFTFDSSTNEVVITGANLRIVNGLGNTATTNGLGNLIVGYNEEREDDPATCPPPDPEIPFPPCINTRTGSHNVVVGQAHNFSSFGGLVVGLSSEISGPFSSVSGGTSNMARGLGASVSGGTLNRAGGGNSSVSGGRVNNAFGGSSSVSGGEFNQASGAFSSVSGGDHNRASGESSSVSGGTTNGASGVWSSVSGGVVNRASGLGSSVSGGAATRPAAALPRSAGGAATRPAAAPPRLVGDPITRPAAMTLRLVGGRIGVRQSSSIGRLAPCLPTTSASAAGSGATHFLPATGQLLLSFGLAGLHAFGGCRQAPRPGFGLEIDLQLYAY